MAHLVPVLATVALMLLLSFVLTGLGNPIALAYGAAATLGVTFVKDRRLAVALAVIAVLALATTLVALAQPGYVTVGRLF